MKIPRLIAIAALISCGSSTFAMSEDELRLRALWDKNPYEMTDEEMSEHVTKNLKLGLNEHTNVVYDVSETGGSLVNAPQVGSALEYSALSYDLMNLMADDIDTYYEYMKFVTDPQKTDLAKSARYPIPNELRNKINTSDYPTLCPRTSPNLSGSAIKAIRSMIKNNNILVTPPQAKSARKRK